MLKLTDEARVKIRERLNNYCLSGTTKCEECFCSNKYCNFNIMGDTELLECYHKWLDMIIHEELLGEEE